MSIDPTVNGTDSAQQLLHDAAQSLDVRMLASIVNASVEHIDAWTTGATPMTFTDRLGCAMAIVTLAPIGSALFHRAARIRTELAQALPTQVAGVDSETGSA